MTEKTENVKLSKPPSGGIYDDDTNAAPLHFHALRSTPSLTAAAPPKPLTNTPRSRSSSRSRSRSRSNSFVCSRDSSPAPNQTFDPSTTSLEDFLNTSLSSMGKLTLDPDILTDKAGMEEMTPGRTLSSVSSNDPDQNSSISLVSTSSRTLPCVNERMSDESLEDKHAFCDLKNVILGEGGMAGMRGGLEPPTDLLIRSREGSVAGSILGKEDASYMLETLEEFEDEESEDGTRSGTGTDNEIACVSNNDTGIRHDADDITTVNLKKIGS